MKKLKIGGLIIFTSVFVFILVRSLQFVGQIAELETQLECLHFFLAISLCGDSSCM